MYKKIFSLLLVIVMMFNICSCTSNTMTSTNIDNTVSNNKNQTKIVFPNFSTIDLSGNTVTNDIFANKDLTVLNVWGTYCPPCIAEMPELGQWNKSLPDNIQILGMIIDVDSDTLTNKEEALSIINETGADFTHIVINQSLVPFLSDVYAVPTTFFIKNDGSFYAEPCVGALVDNYKKVVNVFLNENK